MTSFTLKIIAILAMTFDHIYKILRQTGLMALFPSLTQSSSYWAGTAMEAIGRIAFPLFAFMITEGAAKTRSMPKYIGRLALFAVLSEPAFYFAFSPLNRTVEGLLASLSRYNLTNVFFTLALGALAIFCHQIWKGSKFQKQPLVLVPVWGLILFCAAYIGCDYGMAGVALILALYLAKTKKQKTMVILVWSVYLYIISQGWGNWSQVWTRPIMNCICASLSCILIWRYNGKRGKPFKWTFYLYYPAHLLLLICIRTLLAV